jgi:hypothetical protein
LGVFGGGGVARARGRVTLFVSRFPPQENARPIEPCSISKIELLHLRNILLLLENYGIIKIISAGDFFEGTVSHPKWM